MTGDEDTEAAHALAWFVGILALVLIVLGVFVYGASSGVFQRLWQDLVPSISTRKQPIRIPGHQWAGKRNTSRARKRGESEMTT